jgi:hypothetical protein
MIGNLLTVITITTGIYMNLPLIKQTVLSILLIPAIAGATENGGSFRLPQPASSIGDTTQPEKDPLADVRYNQYLTNRLSRRQRVCFDCNLDTFVGVPLVLEDYLPLLRGHRIAQIPCSSLLPTAVALLLLLLSSVMSSS